MKRCSHCGKSYYANGFVVEDRVTMLMTKKKLCYDCAYWTNLLHYPPPHTEVAGNKCLRVMPRVKGRDRSMMLGGDGKLRIFLRTDWSEIVYSNDVWTIGTIPESFRGIISPTLIEITKKTRDKLKKNMNRCCARGCFDRYHCLRYKREIENDRIGAFNEVPPAWKIGDEHCKYFINIHKETLDESSEK